MSPAVKICGLTRQVDARVAVEAGAAYLGVVLVPGSPRAVPVEEAAAIRGRLDVSLVLVTADRKPEELAELARAVGAEALQLHGDESPDDVRRLRDSGDWTLWKSVRIREAEDLEAAVRRFGGLVDGIHLDGWHPRRLGGTGERFPWKEVARLRDRVPRETTLVAAGGLTPENVSEAVALLRPDVVDVSSGVESRPREKDPRKVEAFVRAARDKERSLR